MGYIVVRADYYSTSWFKLNGGDYLPHERRMHYLLECHMFSIVLTATIEGDMARFLFRT